MLIMQLSHVQSKGEAYQIQEIYRGIENESLTYIVLITVAVKKGFGNLKIASC